MLTAVNVLNLAVGNTALQNPSPGEYYPIEEDEHGTYIFNSKDLCLIHRIPELYEAGIDSLKIEGRMKSVHYCATVAKVYRTAIDTYLKERETGTFVQNGLLNQKKFPTVLTQMALRMVVLMKAHKTTGNLQILNPMIHRFSTWL